jgi:hypothetical protein
VTLCAEPAIGFWQFYEIDFAHPSLLKCPACLARAA